MTTSVPQITFGPNGFIIPEQSAILAGTIADMQTAFGGNLNLSLANPSSLSTPQGQLASSLAAIIEQANETFLNQSRQTDPAFADGRWQDAIGRIYFLTRIGSEPTVLQIVCSGALGVSIPVNSTIQDSDGNVYACTEAGVIPSGGSITLTFANQIPGPIAVPSVDDVSIYQAIPGWDSVTVASGVLGNDTETRSQFEARRAASVALNSIGSLPAILGSVLSVAGVLDAHVTENATNAPVSVLGATLAANSLYVAVVGGAATDVAQAIWVKKAPGCSYNGNTTIAVQDSNSGYSPPFPSYNVSFEIPPSLAILFAVNLANSVQVPSNATVLIQNALLSAFAGGDGGPRARIGSKLFASRFYSTIAALGSWVNIISILIGSNNSPGAVFSGTIAGATLTVGALVSGTIAIGQTISDVNGDIAVGTTITAGSGSSWTVNPSQTVAGASFTGTGSGTNLTASGVTGVIEIGNTISGTGVPANTTIISQTSGTPGGAGVYVTSGATTASTSALLAKKTITAAVASLNNLQVNINQAPTLSANDIQVTLT